MQYVGLLTAHNIGTSIVKTRPQRTSCWLHKLLEVHNPFPIVMVEEKALGP